MTLTLERVLGPLATLGRRNFCGLPLLRGGGVNLSVAAAVSWVWGTGSPRICGCFARFQSEFARRASLSGNGRTGCSGEGRIASGILGGHRLSSGAVECLAGERTVSLDHGFFGVSRGKLFLKNWAPAVVAVANPSSRSFPVCCSQFVTHRLSHLTVDFSEFSRGRLSF